MGKESYRFQRNILLTLGLVLVLFFIASQVLPHQLFQQYFQDHMQADLAGTTGLYELEISEKSGYLSSLVDFLQNDVDIRSAWDAKDRDLLLEHARAYFETTRSNQSVTHLYFHGLDRVCFLRVHNPERHSDYIDRFTMAKAVNTSQPASGIELGPLGTFTLRVVKPWRINGELVGYIEMGQEIDSVFRTLKATLSKDFFLLIDKTYLNRTSWEEGMRILGRSSQWDQFPDVVVSSCMLEPVPEGFGSVSGEP